MDSRGRYTTQARLTHLPAMSMCVERSDKQWRTMYKENLRLLPEGVAIDTCVGEHDMY